jgi:DNA-binding response OmpR family regulator
MFSVKGELTDKVRSLKEGASGYITKPFVVDELVARVRRVLAEGDAG